MTIYTLPDLPYDYSALEPHISRRIMELHHDKHHANYVAGANAALEKLAAAREDGTFDETKADLVARYEDETVNPEVSVASGQLDGIIAPADTRQTIIDSLHLLATKDQRAPHVKRHDNGPL